MDSGGDIALGYSVSSSSMYPAVRYTGRVPSDPLGTMEAEKSIEEGGGAQTQSLNRWGDYTSMSIDPVDDCTFWYTNQYLQNSGTFNWSTRIGSFKFPSCIPPDTQPPSVPTGLSATAVSSTQINLSWTASTDNVGVAGYRVFRGGSQITMTTATSYADAGLSPSTNYTYTVVAFDAAGNVSAQSSPASATTPGGTPPPPTSAVFLSVNSTPQGTWKGQYGANGFAIVNDSTSYPAYAQVSLSNASLYTWAASTADVRALQKALSSTDRIASTWYAGSFTLDVNLSDGNTHQVALYALDWDGNSRAETIEILDAANSTVLDTRTVSSFPSGEYLVWNLRGHVQIRITRTAGANAVVSGIFF